MVDDTRGGGRGETLTVLFTDMAGSTELRTQLGEEAFDRLRYSHDALVRGAIQGGRGTVIKSTGDGVMATFTGAADAVAAAVAVQQAIHHHNRHSDAPALAVRIGISVGDVTIDDDGDCFGLPVVEAQRLEGASTSGQILCSSLVRALARGRGDHRFRSVGELALKGLPDPLEVDEVLWEPALAGTSAARVLPPLLIAENTFGFVGRAREFAVLIDAWKASLEGPGHLVLLAGEPGIGKTRLVTELARAVLDQGGIVLAGRSDEDVNSPYGPYADALLWWARHVGPDVNLGEMPGDLARIAPALASVVPGLEAVPSGDPDSDRGLLNQAVRSWLEATATVAPVLLVLDDLHWADSATLQLVRSLFDRAPLERLLVVGTYRDTDLDRRHPLAATLADLRRHDHVVRISVEGLDEDGVIDFLTVAANDDIGDPGLALARAVFRETSGNPFFVGEVLRHLLETGAIVERDGTWTSDLDPSEFGIPEGIREVVGRRLARLGDETDEMLSAAAVIGLEFDLDLVVAVLGVDEDRVVDAFERASQAALVEEVTADRWRFTHGIVRETLLDELSSSRRVRQHRKVANAIEERSAADLDAVVNQLAYHWGEAAAGGLHLDKAFPWACRAGDLALAKPALEDAIRWYEHALGLLDPDEPTPDLECAVLIKLARAKALSGGTGSREPMFRAATIALELGDHDLLTQALAISVRIGGYSTDDALADRELVAYLDRALAEVGPDEPALRAQLLSALALELQFLGEADRRVALCREALDLAKTSGDPVALDVAYHALFVSLPWRLFTREMASELLDYQLDRLENLSAFGDHHHLARCLSMAWYLAILLARGDLARTVEHLGNELLERRPTPVLEENVKSRAVLAALIAGDLDRAERDRRELARLSRALEIRLPGHQVFAYTIALEGGYIELGIPNLEEAARTLAQRLFAEGLLALALAETDELDRANVLFDAFSNDGIQNLPDDLTYSVTIGLWVEVGILLRRADRCAAMTTWLAALGETQFMATGVLYLGSADRLRGSLAHLQGENEEAEACFRSAVEAHTSIGAIPLLAATHLDWATILIDQGDRDDARGHIQTALQAIGDLPLIRQTRRAQTLTDQINAV